MTKRSICTLILLLGLAGCDRINRLANAPELNARAIGAGCREAGRSLEDCYERNERVSKADIYDGWREMNEYMSKNKLPIIPPLPGADRASATPQMAPNIQISGTPDTSAPGEQSASPTATPAETPKATPAP